MTLLALLLQASLSGSTAVEASDTDLMEIQLKLMQLALCGMQQYMQDRLELPANGTLPEALHAPGLENCSCLAPPITEGGPSNESNCTTGGYSWVGDVVNAAYRDNTTWPYNISSTTVGLSELPNLPSGRDADLLLLIMILSMTVLAVFIIREAVQAMQLSYALALYGNFLPIEFSKPEDREIVVVGFCSCWRLAIAYCMPLFQMSVAVVALVTAAVTLTSQDFVNDKMQFIINSVALAFIVEVDDMAGDVLSWTIRTYSMESMLDPFPASRHSVAARPETHLGKCERALWLFQKIFAVCCIAFMPVIAQWGGYQAFIHVAKVSGPDMFTSRGGPLLMGGVMGLYMAFLLAEQPYIVPQHDAGLRSVFSAEGIRSLRSQASLVRVMWLSYNYYMVWIVVPLVSYYTTKAPASPNFLFAWFCVSFGSYAFLLIFPQSVDIVLHTLGSSSSRCCQWLAMLRR